MTILARNVKDISNKYQEKGIGFDKKGIEIDFWPGKGIGIDFPIKKELSPTTICMHVHTHTHVHTHRINFQ